MGTVRLFVVKGVEQVGAERLSQRDRHSVTDLAGDGDLRPDPLVIVGKALDSGGLMMGQRAVLGRVEIAALLRLEELRSNGHGRLVKVETPHHVATPAFM